MEASHGAPRCHSKIVLLEWTMRLIRLVHLPDVPILGDTIKKLNEMYNTEASVRLVPNRNGIVMSARACVSRT